MLPDLLQTTAHVENDNIRMVYTGVPVGVPDSQSRLAWPSMRPQDEGWQCLGTPVGTHVYLESVEEDTGLRYTF